MTGEDRCAAATEQMFALVGRAITEWAFVEARLSSIFTICLGTVIERTDINSFQFMDNIAPNQTFYSVENFRSRLALVDAAITGRVVGFGRATTAEIVGEWSKLKEKTRKLSLKRNRLAHWSVLPAVTVDEAFFPARLVPPFGSPAYFRETGMNPTGQALKACQLGHLELAFRLLSGKLRDFGYDLARREELFEQSARLLERRYRLLARTNPTRAKRLARAVSSPE